MMTEQDAERISSSPTRYDQWLSCFEKLKSRMIDHEEYAILCCGSCEDSELTIEYYEKQLISVINAMINRCTEAFKKELGMYVAFNETENLHIPYRRFSGRIKMCMFYRELSFLSERFKNELSGSIESEVKKFWDRARRALYDSCIDGSNVMLEDEIYLIDRIKLF